MKKLQMLGYKRKVLPRIDRIKIFSPKNGDIWFNGNELLKKEKGKIKKLINCKNCYGKGYSTEMQGRIGSSRVTLRGPKMVVNICDCDRGKQLLKYFKIKK